jgi:hypothetical protein
MTVLRRANLAPVSLLIAHTMDHLVRHPSGGRRISARLWIGVAALYGSVASALVLAARGDHRAPTASAGAGIASFMAPLLAHAAPQWGPLSQSYRDADADAFSWALLFGVALAGAAVGIAGLSERRKLKPGATAVHTAVSRDVPQPRGSWSDDAAGKEICTKGSDERN